jgi:hypothetical protein
VIRFLHTSDWQIGMKGGHLKEAAPLVTEARIASIRSLMALARERECAFVAACGDLFENNAIDRQQIANVAAVLAEFPDVMVEAIPGNHDPDGHGSVWRDRAMANLPNLRLHRVPGPIEAHGVTLLPLPVTDATSAMDALRTLPDCERGRAIQIALGHGHVTAWSFGGHEDEVRLPLDITHVDRSGIDFLALGHWHGTRTRPGADGAVRVAYSGTHEQTKFTETGAGNVLVVEIGQPGATPVVEEHRVAQLVWAVVAFEFGRDGAMPELDAALAGTDADLTQITLTGPFPIAHRDRLATLLAKHRGRFQHTKLEQNLRWTREASSGHAIADPGLRDALGEIEKMIESLDDQTSVGAEAARRARDLLLELDEDAAR